MLFLFSTISNRYKFFLFVFLFVFLRVLGSNSPIMLLDPAGHSGDVGRWLVKGSERGETLKFAKSLEKELVKKYKVRSVLSRSTDEEVLDLQIPSFSNRLGADFFLRIHMYKQEDEKPKLFLYHLLFDKVFDISVRSTEKFSFVSVRRAHFFNINKTIIWGNKMYEYLNKEKFNKHFDCYKLKGLPLKHLIGITAPAILLEIGLCRESMWKNLIEPIAEALGQ